LQLLKFAIHECPKLLMKNNS